MALQAEGATRRLVVYDFTETRAGAHPPPGLADGSGYLLAAAYGGDDRLFAHPARREVGCWA
jgi:hypothetical protein